MKKIIQLWKFLTRRKVLFLVYFILPLLLAWFIYAIFMTSLPRNLPIGIVDFDNTKASADVVFALNSSPSMNITKQYHSIAQAKQDLATTKIYALVVIPYNYQRDIQNSVGAELVFYYNAQFVLIGKTLNSAFTEIVGNLNATEWTAKNLPNDENLKLAISKSMPIFSQIVPLYNSNNNYAQFLLTLLLPCMLQILSAIGMANILRHTPSSIKSLCIRYVFNSCIFVFWGLCMIMFLKALGYETRGNLGLLIFGIALLIFGVNAVVLIIQSVLFDIRHSMGALAVTTAPSLAFAGITYPQNSMNFLALFWSKFLPISHFMELYVQQANYDGSEAGAFRIIGGMLWFLLFFVLGAGIYKLRIKT